MSCNTVVWILLSYSSMTSCSHNRLPWVDADTFECFAHENRHQKLQQHVAAIPSKDGSVEGVL